MESKSTAFGIVEAVIWCFLDTMKKERNLWLPVLVLLVLAYLGFVTCPWICESEAWKQL